MRESRWTRALTEMVVIVASILLAFAVQAWWEGRQERRALAGIEELLRVQMLANAVTLQREIDGARTAQEALGTAVRAISPEPAPLTADSLWSLLRRGWGMRDQELETSALESLLALDTFEPARRPELYRQMVAFRGRAGGLGRNVERFVDVKVRTSDYLMSVSPLPTLSSNDPDPESAFPVPVDTLLRDRQLEGLFRELYYRQGLRESWALQLMELADSISRGLGVGSRAP